MASSNSFVSATGGTYSSSSLVDGAVELEAADEPVAVGANVKAADDVPLELDPKLNPELAGLEPKQILLRNKYIIILTS